MIISAAKIFSELGNPNSLVPLAVKDLTGIAGMTAGSLITGKEEGKDRFIDEMGTSLIWLLGIPSLKWLYNSSVFKALGLDSKFDPRNLEDKDVFQKIKEYAPDEKVKKGIEKIEKKQGLFKNTVSTRFVFSTALTVIGYIMLTKFKQNYTEKQIRQNLIDEYNQGVNKGVNKGVNEGVNDSLADKQLSSSDNNDKNGEANSSDALEKVNPAFKGIGPMVEYFAFSPVRNMWILEGAITTERLKDSRSPQEFIGYAIKEAAAWIFLYFAGAKIQKAVEKKTKEKHQKSIELDARVIEGGDLKKSFEDGSVEKCLKEFKNANTSKVNLYEFLHKNPDNIIVKTAKQSDIIKMYKKTDKIDTREYIDLKEVEGVNSKIEELYGQYKDALKKGETSDKFFNQLKKLKRKSVIANIGSCALALGVITPGIMLAKRMMVKDDAEFHTKKQIREQLIEEGIIA